MKKIGSVITGFFLIIGAVLLREIVAELGLYGYAYYRVASGEIKSGEDLSFVQSLAADTNFLLLVSALGTLAWILVFGIIYKKERHLSGRMLLSGRLPLNRVLMLGMMGLGIQFFMNSILGAMLKISPSTMESYQQLMNTLGMGTSLISLVYIVVIAPIGEELVFRALALNYLKKHLPFWTANLFQALFFGLYHMNLVQGSYAFVLGMLLGWVAKKYGSIRESILLHMAVNASACLVSAFMPEKMADSWVGLGILLLLSVLLLVISLKTVKMEEVEIAEIENTDMVEEE